MSQIGANVWTERARMVVSAKESTNFVDLVKISGLDKATDFRFANWSGVDFSGCNLAGFDFTGARLHGCNFKRAIISGARFDQAEIGAVLHDGKANPRDPARQTKFANLRDAADWAACFDPKRWRKRSAPLSADHLPTGAVFQDAPFAPELVVVPPGKFLMGSPDGSGGDQGDKAEEGRTDPEGPRQLVTLERPFAIGRFAVKLHEFIAFEQLNRHRVHVPADPRIPPDPLDLDNSHPAINVRWVDAVAYCDWLNEKLGLPAGTYRLPSEAEWEYAARAGTDGPFWWNGRISRDKANYDIKTDSIYPLKGHFVKTTVPVQRFDPNPWGLYQVHGNVWEWCQDVYTETLTDIPPDGSPRHFTGNHDVRRVKRGGCWHSGLPEILLRLAYRAGSFSDAWDRGNGFRVARTLTV
jgi:formylglycine-generating enzyme required for sulfatase activity